MLGSEGQTSHQRAPFSFHCNICFEALNVTTRAPVVLPCGHTYLCAPCSQRLDKCMECRTPLSIGVNRVIHQSLPPSPRIQPSPSRVGTMRSSYRGHATTTFNAPPSPPAMPQEKIHLPIPKNHVLMSLIDAVQSEPIVEEGYESGDDDEVVLRGMKVLGSSSGTYVVREPNGLTVHPIPPKDSSKPTNDSGEELEQEESPSSETKTLQYGQTVQVFMFENRIATLARGAGYVLVDFNQQLVKVGEVMDETCKLEATERVLALEIEEMEKRLNRLKASHSTVSDKLQHLLATTDKSEVFGPVPSTEDDATTTEETCTGSKLDASTDHSRRHECVRFADEPQRLVYGHLIASNSYDQMTDTIPAIGTSRSFDNVSRLRMPISNGGVGSFDQADVRQPQSMSNSPYVRCERERAELNSRRGSIDFASGMSGHRGLSRSQVVQRKSPVAQNLTERKVRMMSHYSGFL
eukprot:Nitzschia sp. Nitz4//scaffold35_size145790//28134//29604//NITZ4_003013-RA/size145790-snap-gene-0.5-mRNA-1//1//CDS//3329549073//3904//frame0